MRQRTAAAALLLVSTLFFASLSAFAQIDHADPRDEAAIHDYVLTMPRIQAYATAMKAAQSDGMNDDSLKSECKKLDDDKMGLMDKVQYIESSCPKMNAWIKQHGLTAKEFMLIPMSLITAGFAQVAADAGGKPPAFINPANIQFLKEHKSDLDKLDLLGEHNGKSGKSDDSNDDKNP